MVTLFIDTANSDLILSLYSNNLLLADIKEKNDNLLSSKLVALLKTLLDMANITPDEVNTIIVVNGPGSFTGARMGVTVAKTYAWALNKKIVPISSLELMATTKFNGDYILPLIDAKHDCVYAGLYDQEGNVIIKDAYLKLEDLLTMLPKDKKIVATTSDLIDLSIDCIETNKDVLKMILKHSHDMGENPHTVKPNYLKKTEAEEKLAI